MAQKVYVQDNVHVGQPVIGWDQKNMELVKTTPVVDIKHNQDGTVTASTEFGGKYILTSHR